MSFAIYFPSKTGANVQHFHAAGLGDLLGETSPTFVDVFSGGPDGGRGEMASWLGRPFLAGEFDWTKIKRADPAAEFWLGRGEGLSPESFARPSRQLGEDLVMGDGQRWHVPHARQLPSVLQLDEAGQWRGKIAPAYETFWKRSWEALEWFVPDEKGEAWVDFQDGADFAALALSINYRVNRDVASWLGLVRSDLLFRVVKIVTQYEDLLAAEKKTEPPGSPTDVGASA